MFCPKCGTKALDGTTFCQKCGAKLIVGHTEQQVAASTPVRQTQSPTPLDTPKKKKSKKLPIILGIAALVIAVVVFVALNWEGKTDYVATVRAHQPFVSQGTSLTYGEVLDKYISSPTWEVRNFGDVNYVDISDKAKGNGNELFVIIKVTDDPSDPDLAKITPESVTIDGEKSPTYDDAVKFLLAMFLAYDGRDNDLSELLSGAGLAGAQGEVSLTETYTNEVEGFSFSYPSELKFNHMDDYGVEDASGFSCLCLLANDVSASPYTQIVVLKNSNPQFVKSVFSDDSKFLTMFKYNLDAYLELETSIGQLDGRPVRLINYVQNIASDVAQAYSYQVYIYVNDSALYQVIFACPKDEIENQENIFNAIIDSYTITAANPSEEIKTSNSVKFPLVVSTDAMNLFAEWAEKHPLVGNYYLDLISDDDVDDEGNKIFLFTFEGNGGIFNMSIRKSDGYMEYISKFDSMSMDEWYKDFFGEANQSMPDRVPGTVPSGLLYRGQPVLELFGKKPEELNQIFGAPTGGTPVTEELFYGATEFYVYDGIGFMFDEQGSVSNITISADQVELNGQTLNQNRAGILNLLGTPEHEEQLPKDESGEGLGGYYIIEYSTYDGGFVTNMTIEIPDAESKAYNVVISQSYVD